ncbi:MAG: hypothetical protein F7C33_01365 [Desulfurococcales archaeon]|nr:hypothetical protein [Desulfurococcales archaeon]
MKASQCLSITARKRQVIVLAIAISVVAAVASALALLQSVLASTQTLAEKIMRPTWKLVPDPSGRILECTGTLSLGNSTIHVPVIVVPDNYTLISIKKPRNGNASIGYLIPKLRMGKTITINLGDSIYKLEIGSIHHANSGLDVSIIAWSNRMTGCNGLHLRVEKASVQRYSKTLARQFSGLVGKWRLSGIIVLAVGSVTASIKAMSDLTRESITLLEEGASSRCLATSLALVLAVAAFTGYAWGWIVTSMADSAAALITGVFLPIPRVTVVNLFEAGVVPALLVFALSLLTGELHASCS